MDQHPAIVLTAECGGILSILSSGVMCSGVHRRHRPAHYHPAVSREVKLSALVKTWRHTVDTADRYSGYSGYLQWIQWIDAVGAFSVIVKTGCETDGSFHSTSLL